MVMLEKIAVVTLVSKLHALLLMEADFNFQNKLIFGKQSINQAELLGVIPDEHYAQKGTTLEDGAFHKQLNYNVGRQTRHPLSLVSVDAANCYDRIAHAIMALVLLALGIPVATIAALLLPIQ